MHELLFNAKISVHDCGTPESILNGAVLFNEMTFGATARYVCNTGYYLNGSDSTVCTFQGWNGQVPSCES